MNATEKRIIELINLKKLEGYKYLYNNFYPSLCRFSFRITKNKSESEDIVQDFFLRLWRSNIKIYSKKALTSYLYLSIKNASLNSVRNKSKLTKLGNSQINLFDNLSSNVPSIQQIMIEEEVYRQIHVAINKLSPERQNVILLSMQGLSNLEIANNIGISINTVKTLKLKSYKILRKDLKPAFYTFLL